MYMEEERQRIAERYKQRGIQEEERAEGETKRHAEALEEGDSWLTLLHAPVDTALQRKRKREKDMASEWEELCWRMAATRKRLESEIPLPGPETKNLDHLLK